MADVLNWPGAIGGAVIAMLIGANAALAQQFADQTSTRFPVQSEYTNYIAVGDIDGDGDPFGASDGRSVQHGLGRGGR